MTITIGSKVQCGVYVCGEFKPTHVGIVVSQTFDGSVSDVDIGSLHGCSPWIRKESTTHLQKVNNDE